jgi:hypothetical protein
VDGDDEHTAAVELSSPTVTPDGITFEYRELEKARSRPGSRTSSARPGLPTELREVALFIDRVRSIPVNSQMTD